jgi:phage N-6-adenine-methyltransferase
VSEQKLVLYDKARAALQKATRVDEVKKIRDRAEAARAYARQSKNREMETDAMEIRVRATRRLDEIIKAQGAAPREKGGGLNKGKLLRGSKPDPRESASPTLAEMGIDKHLADEARKLGAIPEEKFEENVAAWRERVSKGEDRVTAKAVMSGAHVGNASGENEWYTPAEYIEAARKVMGAIDVDPASCATANTVVGAKQVFSTEDDGLAHEWRGRVFMNPPYAQPFVGQFVEKLLVEWEAARTTEAIVLVNNATDTDWFQRLAAKATAVCFPRGRIRFWHPERSSSAPLQGQAILYFGSANDIFFGAFAALGAVALWTHE